jgi:Ca2+-binding EF-hand superfamily protein
MLHILACMAAGTIFGASLAIAIEAMPESQPSFQLSEYQERFRAADRNADGVLSREEAEAARMHRIVQYFERLDVDRDGKLDPAEFRRSLGRRVTT